MEDAISGLVAGRTAGALTLAVCTSTERVKLVEGGKPDFIVQDLTKFVFICCCELLLMLYAQSLSERSGWKNSADD